MSDLIRRDPRAEWIARNRLHPLHASLQPVLYNWLGPNGLLRKNPHGVGFIGPNGIKRIDRSGAQQLGACRSELARDAVNGRRSAPAEEQLPLHVVADPAFYLCVVPDLPGGRLSSHDRDLFGLARQLAGSSGAVLAVVFGEHKETAFDLAGVDRLLQLTDAQYQGYAPQQQLAALIAL
ncbi:MAG: electron transfer flavoprotein subunit alpha/FixB family protein, partial [Pseudomonadaceae bacterium]|nr:electron transfer flavoprotein subunit alpha/FixB family protein [Pseudomonadaceae bacterium]